MVHSTKKIKPLCLAIGDVANVLHSKVALDTSCRTPNPRAWNDQLGADLVGCRVERAARRMAG
jgi:hypothetical protein